MDYNEQAMALGFKDMKSAVKYGYRVEPNSKRLVKAVKRPVNNSYAETCVDGASYSVDDNKWVIDKKAEAEIMAETIALDYQERNLFFTNEEYDKLIKCLEPFMEYIEYQVNELNNDARDTRTSIESDIKEMIG